MPECDLEKGTTMKRFALALAASCALILGAGSAHAQADPPDVTISDPDSITAGGGNYGGYCRLVVHGLKTKGIRVKGIYAGVPGNKSSDMLLRLDGILKQKPDHLHIVKNCSFHYHLF